jgi:hypothetical protein
MSVWILLLVAVGLLWMMRTREHYVEVPGPGVRPSLNDASWRSKIDAQAPIGGNDEDYVAALQKFYDTVYKVKRPEGATTSPKDTDVEAFLTANTFPTVSKDSLRQIILSGFSIDRTESAAAREKKQVRFQPTEALQPRDGVDEVYGHNDQELYKPADSRTGPVPEGVYRATPQTEPSRPLDWDERSTSWSPPTVASVCKCAQNVL